MQHCNNCTLDDSIEGISIEDGACNFCRSYRIKWKSDALHDNSLERALGEIRANGGRCIIPLSGGLDSLYAVYYAVKILGLKPEIVTFDNGYQTGFALDNIARITKRLGLTHRFLRMDPLLRKKIYRACFRKIGEVCTACNSLIYHSVYRYAADGNIPHVLFGISSKVETSPIYDGLRYCREELFKSILEGVLSRDEIEDLSIKRITERFEIKPLNLLDLVDYRHKKAVGEFLEAGILDEKSLAGGTKHRDCRIAPLNSYVKWKKYGFGKEILYQASLVRDGQMDREDASFREKSKKFPVWVTNLLRKDLDLTDGDLNGFWKKKRESHVHGKRRIGEILDLFRRTSREQDDLPSRVGLMLKLANEELREDGGRLEMESLDSGLLLLSAKGFCRVCVLKSLTLTSFAEGLFLSAFPANILAVKIV
jgi:Fe-S cluster biogenesis protein NfuA/predicted PP-loop superfamily ATPase